MHELSQKAIWHTGIFAEMGVTCPIENVSIFLVDTRICGGNEFSGVA